MVGNFLLISLDKLKDEGWFFEEDFFNILEFLRDKVDFDLVV